jgi:hypothetical protein
MLKFLIAVAYGAIVYTLGFALTDGVFIPIPGIYFSLFFAAVFVLPLRPLLRFVLPQTTQKIRAIVAAGILFGLVLWAMFAIPPAHLPHGRVAFLLFWMCYLVTLIVGLFRPFAVPATEVTAD